MRRECSPVHKPGKGAPVTYTHFIHRYAVSGVACCARAIGPGDVFLFLCAKSSALTPVIQTEPCTPYHHLDQCSRIPRPYRGPWDPHQRHSQHPSSPSLLPPVRLKGYGTVRTEAMEGRGGKRHPSFLCGRWRTRLRRSGSSIHYTPYCLLDFCGRRIDRRWTRRTLVVLILLVRFLCTVECCVFDVILPHHG